MHVGESEIAAGVAVGELFVIEAYKMKQRSVEIVDVDTIFDSTEAELVGGAMHVPTANPAAGEPHREAVMVVITAVDFSLVAAFFG